MELHQTLDVSQLQIQKKALLYYIECIAVKVLINQQVHLCTIQIKLIYHACYQFTNFNSSEPVTFQRTQPSYH